MQSGGTEGLSKLAAMLYRLEEEKRQLSEAASKFPRTTVEYMALPLEKRIAVATDILKEYTRTGADEALHPEQSNTATGKVQTDKPGVILEAKVTYRDHAYPNHYLPRERARIVVWVHAVDTQSEIGTKPEWLGTITDSRYFDENEGRQKGVHGEDYDAERYPVYGFPLSDERAQTLIEFVDVAACGLIEGIVAKNSSLIGRTAISTKLDS